LYAKYNSQAGNTVPHNIGITVIIENCMRTTRDATEYVETLQRALMSKVDLFLNARKT
jgi:hypothetical protein